MKEPKYHAHRYGDGYPEIRDPKGRGIAIAFSDSEAIRIVDALNKAEKPKAETPAKSSSALTPAEQ